VTAAELRDRLAAVADELDAEGVDAARVLLETLLEDVEAELDDEAAA
jgi:hypothetical protein